MAKLCHCLRLLSFLKRRLSSYLLSLQGNSGVPGLLLIFGVVELVREE